MPELAEVEFFRRRWNEAAQGSVVRRVTAHAGKRVFRGDSGQRVQDITGRQPRNSWASGKQMLFQFGDDAWLAVHLGMSGELSVQPPSHRPNRHDHLVLFCDDAALVFSDPRMFGAIRFDRGPDPPEWWKALPPSVLSKQFTNRAVAEFLRRRAQSPIKAVLLMQERFPGIGNWMADEILWRAGIHPAEPAGALSAEERQRLRTECRRVARLALQRIAGVGGPLPPDLNVNIPETWLFHHRWREGGRCPRSGVRLKRAEIGGRTTCWSPARQELRSSVRRRKDATR